MIQKYFRSRGWQLFVGYGSPVRMAGKETLLVDIILGI